MREGMRLTAATVGFPMHRPVPIPRNIDSLTVLALLEKAAGTKRTISGGSPEALTEIMEALRWLEANNYLRYHIEAEWRRGRKRSRYHITPRGESLLNALRGT